MSFSADESVPRRPDAHCSTMPIPNRERFPSDEPRFLIEVTDDGSRTLVRRTDGVTFHSSCGAVAECDHVYVRNSGLFSHTQAVGVGALGVGASRTEAAPVPTPRVLELGFGTGLALLRCVGESLQMAMPLEYVSIESQPLGAATLAQILRPVAIDDDRLSGFLERFLRWYAENVTDAVPAVHGLSIDRYRNFQLHVGDALEWGDRLEPSTFHAIFFDPFDPQTNPELWEVDFLGRMHALLTPGGRLVTYCVKSLVRRRMESAGFTIERVPGPPGGKREVLIATATR